VPDTPASEVVNVSKLVSISELVPNLKVLLFETLPKAPTVCEWAITTASFEPPKLPTG